MRTIDRRYATPLTRPVLLRAPAVTASAPPSVSFYRVRLRAGHAPAPYVSFRMGAVLPARSRR